MILAFDPEAWRDLNWWQQHDRNVHKRVVKLIDATLRDPYEGEGKPELLHSNLAGCWSRRITREHRLVYRVVPPPKDPPGTDETLLVIACRYHY